MADLTLRNHMLERENEALRERVAQLEQALLGDGLSYSTLGLPRAEARILAALMSRERLSKDALHAALYGDRLEVDTPAVETIESHVSKLRKKLRALGVQVCARRYQGYWMEPEQKIALRQFLAAMPQRIAA